MKIIVYLLIAYAGFTLLVFFAQRKLLYLPANFQLSEQAASEQGLRHWPSYQHYRGFIGDTTPVDTKGTIIVFHGNAGAASYRRYYADALSAHGFRVILAEYPGYGGRPGKPSETALIEDALETIDLAYRAFGDPVFLWGESLGGGVASAVAATTEIPIKGLVLLTPWDSLSNLAQRHYWFLPARWLVLDRYDNVNNLARFKGKVAVILAAKDEVIPLQHGKNLYQAINTDKKMWLFENAGHNSWPVKPHSPWWREVCQFMLQ